MTMSGDETKTTLEEVKTKIPDLPTPKPCLRKLCLEISVERNCFRNQAAKKKKKTCNSSIKNSKNKTSE